MLGRVGPLAPRSGMTRADVLNERSLPVPQIVAPQPLELVCLLSLLSLLVFKELTVAEADRIPSGLNRAVNVAIVVLMAAFVLFVGQRFAAVLS